MNVPWYHLPALHQQLTGNDPAKVIPLAHSCARTIATARRVHNPQPADYSQGADYPQTAQSAWERSAVMSRRSDVFLRQLTFTGG